MTERALGPHPRDDPDPRLRAYTRYVERLSDEELRALVVGELPVFVRAIEGFIHNRRRGQSAGTSQS